MAIVCDTDFLASSTDISNKNNQIVLAMLRSLVGNNSTIETQSIFRPLTPALRGEEAKDLQAL